LPRTLTILMPNDRTEYWFTERVFEIGDSFEHVGETWVVTSVGARDKETGKHMTVTVRPAHESG
jgi:hypothetical protein